MEEINHLLSLIHPCCSEEILREKTGVDWRGITNAQLIAQDDRLDYIAATEYREFLPLVLRAIYCDYEAVQESLFVDNFLNRPFLQYVTKDGKRATLLNELRARNISLDGWAAPVLCTMHPDELKVSICVINSILKMHSNTNGQFQFREELKHLKRMLIMADGGVTEV